MWTAACFNMKTKLTDNRSLFSCWPLRWLRFCSLSDGLYLLGVNAHTLSMSSSQTLMLLHDFRAVWFNTPILRLHRGNWSRTKRGAFRCSWAAVGDCPVQPPIFRQNINIDSREQQPEAAGVQKQQIMFHKVFWFFELKHPQHAVNLPALQLLSCPVYVTLSSSHRWLKLPLSFTVLTPSDCPACPEMEPLLSQYSLTFAHN